MPAGLPEQARWQAGLITREQALTSRTLQQRDCLEGKS